MNVYKICFGSQITWLTDGDKARDITWHKTAEKGPTLRTSPAYST